MSGDYLQGLHHRLQDAAVTIRDLSDPAPHLDGPHPHADLLRAFSGALNQVAELVRAVDLDLSQDSELCARDLESVAALTQALRMPSPCPYVGGSGTSRFCTLAQATAERMQALLPLEEHLDTWAKARGYVPGPKGLRGMG